MDNKHKNYDYSKDIGLPEVQLRLKLLHRRLKILSKMGDKGILYIGIGSGEDVMTLAQYFKKIVVIDSERETINLMMKLIKKHNLNRVKFICSRIEDFEWDGRKYDHIIIQNLLEHLIDPVKVLRQLSEYLNPKGWIHISVPLANSLHRWLGVEMGYISNPKELSKTDVEYGHYRVYSPTLLRRHVKSAGFSVSFEEPFYLKPLTTAELKHLPMEAHKKLFLLGKKFPQFASYVYMEITKKI